jgi:ubiquinone biosynthesis protein UbiJ
MLQNLQSLLAPPVLERLTLVINHVIGSEPAALERLRAHAGHTLALQLDGWPTLLPAAPPMAWRITPAGLLEWCGLAPQAEAELQVHVDASNPAMLLASGLLGERPAVRIDGNAELAADIGWLLQNLRWDVEADLERLFGRTAAQQLHKLGRALAGALRSGLHTVEPLVERFARIPRRSR